LGNGNRVCCTGVSGGVGKAWGRWEGCSREDLGTEGSAADQISGFGHRGDVVKGGPCCLARRAINPGNHQSGNQGLDSDVCCQPRHPSYPRPPTLRPLVLSGIPRLTPVHDDLPPSTPPSTQIPRIPHTAPAPHTPPPLTYPLPTPRPHPPLIGYRFHHLFPLVPHH